MKSCNVCHMERENDAFSKRVASPDGLNYTCRECIKERCKSWRERNEGAFKAWYQENKSDRAAYWRRWYSENKERRSESYAQWAKQNKHVVNALIAKRSAAKLNATPAWANLDAIRSIYREAARRTKETGIRHEVDHYYPLQGEVVCGLHCEANLQILEKVQNIRKGNRMPEVA